MYGRIKLHRDHGRKSIALLIQNNESTGSEKVRGKKWLLIYMIKGLGSAGNRRGKEGTTTDKGQWVIQKWLNIYMMIWLVHLRQGWELFYVINVKIQTIDDCRKN